MDDLLKHKQVEQPPIPDSTLTHETRTGLTQQELDNIIRHPFSYGLKYAMEMPTSAIVRNNGKFEFRFQPCKQDSTTWYGDCAADVLLSGKALRVGERTIEVQSYHFPDANFKGTHYKLIFRGIVGGKKVYLPIDHSNFYSRLNPMHITTSIDTGFSEFEGERLIGDMNLDSFRNFEEFDINGNPGLSMIGVTERENDMLISVCIYEQDAKGNVIRRYESTYTFPQNFNDPTLSQDRIENRISFNRVHVTDTDIQGFQDFDNGIIRDKTIQAYAIVLNALFRGNRLAIARTRLEATDTLEN